MPRNVRDVDTLQRYLSGVLDRAEHHAHDVDEVALAIIGGIVWRKDSDDIEVMEQDGEMKNVLWVRIGGERYAFTYNHAARAIDVRHHNTRGAVLRSFSNTSSPADVKRFFAGLP